jgi:triacylglycerol lipase
MVSSAARVPSQLTHNGVMSDAFQKSVPLKQTIAWVQRVQQFVILSVALLAVLWLWSSGPLRALLVGAGLMVSWWGLIGLQMAIMLAVHGQDPAPRLPLSALPKTWWREVMACSKVFVQWQPWRFDRVPNAELNGLHGTASKRPVLLIHGFFCNRGLWCARQLELQNSGHACISVTLEPAFGSIDEHVGAIERAVTQLATATGQAPLIVGHSMGGLAARAWLRTTSASRVHRIITLGTPHHGTYISNFALALNAQQMRLDSSWLAQLRADEATKRGVDAYSFFTCIYSNGDNIVFPCSTATLPGAHNLWVSETGHLDLIFSDSSWGLVMQALDAA